MARNVVLKDRLTQLVSSMRNAPIVELDLPRVHLFATLEFCNAIGSLKDRAALWILKSAIERGQIEEKTTVVESSSGNFALALAAYSRMLGLRSIAVIDPNITPFNEAMLRSLATDVIKVQERDDTGGFLKTRLAKVQELCRARDAMFWTNQYGNIDGALGHYHLTAAGICDAFTNLDFVFVGVSSGGTITGLSMRLREKFPGVKLVAVDAEGSMIFDSKPKRRRIPGIGSSIVPDLLKHAHIDDVVIVPERDAVSACRELLSKHKLFVGGSSGAVYHAIQQYFRKQTWSSKTKPNVLFLCADRGLQYMDTIYNDQWVTQVLEA